MCSRHGALSLECCVRDCLPGTVIRYKAVTFKHCASDCLPCSVVNMQHSESQKLRGQAFASQFDRHKALMSLKDCGSHHSATLLLSMHGSL